MELRPLAYYRRNSEEYQRERNRGHQNSAFSHFSHRDQIVNSSVTPIHENNIQTVFQQGTYTVFENQSRVGQVSGQRDKNRIRCAKYLDKT